MLPPRTIEDISAILDQQKPADPTLLEAALATASREPPAEAHHQAMLALIDGPST